MPSSWEEWRELWSPKPFAAVCRPSGNEEDEHENLAGIEQQESDPDGRESWQFLPITQQENIEAVMTNSSEVNMACAHSMPSGQKKFFAHLEINGRRRQFQFVTGATCNVVGLHDLSPHTYRAELTNDSGLDFMLSEMKDGRAAWVCDLVGLSVGPANSDFDIFNRILFYLNNK